MPEADEGPQLHDRLRELLPKAGAQSCQVVATFLDIRGFSTFSARGESFDSALYLRSVYSTILTLYFPDADFFKPTGDGLFIVHALPDDAARVPEIVSSVLSRSIKLVDEFGQITAEDYMVNFAVPQQLGIGIARGSVTRLVSNGIVLDYTGRCLNLAARLMDKARPSGVVFSDRHARQLMDMELPTSFSEDRVCIRGISEQEPIPVFVTKEVEIAPADREPVPQTRNTWGDPASLSVAEVMETPVYSFYLPRAPCSYEEAGVHVQHPSFDQEGNSNGSVHSFSMTGEVDERPAGPVVVLQMDEIKRSIKGIPPTTITKFLGRTKTTYVTFTPYLAPRGDA